MSAWRVLYSSKVKKALDRKNYKLPEVVKDAMEALHIELEALGPTAKSWPNYGRLKAKKNIDLRHCHLIKGNPTYVACWMVDKKRKVIEVYYVGSHEKAPY